MIVRIANIEREKVRSLTIYEMIGKFGDRIPQDVQDEMGLLAEESYNEAEKQFKKLKF